MVRRIVSVELDSKGKWKKYDKARKYMTEKEREKDVRLAKRWGEFIFIPRTPSGQTIAPRKARPPPPTIVQDDRDVSMRCLLWAEYRG